jgi:S-formylglutathione hydrolase FrmB
VVYLLHGYTGTSLLWTGGGYCGEELHIAYLADEAFSKKLAKPMILVAADCSNKFRGSWYRNSPVTGGWETFVTRELVEYMDSTYRTLADRDSRGLAGHSMGGHGTMILAMKHPEVYGAVYAMAPAMMAFENDVQVLFKDRFRSLAERGAEVKFDEEEWQTQAMLALGAAVASNAAKPPYYGDLPLDGEGNIVEATWSTWLEHDPRTMVESCCANLKQLNCIRMDSGQDDAVLESARLFSQALTDHGVPHVFDEYPGTHTDQVASRLRDKVLPFFSDQLKFE